MVSITEASYQTSKFHVDNHNIDEGFAPHTAEMQDKAKVMDVGERRVWNWWGLFSDSVSFICH